MKNHLSVLRLPVNAPVLLLGHFCCCCGSVKDLSKFDVLKGTI